MRPGYQPAPADFPPERWRGTTGGYRPCWWSWHEELRLRDNNGVPNNGVQWADQLALDNSTRRQVEVSGYLVQVTVQKAAFAEHPEHGFFRPTAIEGFADQTFFRPNVTPRECFGRTRPAVDPSLDAEPPKGSPEVVNRPIAYNQLSSDAITVEFIAWR